MDNLFGTGRIIPGTGLLLAASPSVFPPPLLSAAIAWNEPLHAFRAAVGGSGQAGAPLAAAAAMMNTLRTNQPMAVPGARPRARQRDRVQPLSARQRGLLRLGHRSARRRARRSASDRWR